MQIKDIKAVLKCFLAQDLQFDMQLPCNEYWFVNTGKSYVRSYWLATTCCNTSFDLDNRAV